MILLGFLFKCGAFASSSTLERKYQQLLNKYRKPVKDRTILYILFGVGKGILD